jgi:hypothetical protein
MPQDLGATRQRIAIPGAQTALETSQFVQSVRKHQAESPSAADPAAERSEASGSPPPVPCLNCDISTEHGGHQPVAFPATAARTAFALALNVEEGVGRWGLDNTGFLTLTFAKHIVEPKEAQRRMNSLTTHVLRPRYGGAIRVFERQKSGRIHYHLLVNVGKDIRTGVDFQAIADQDYRTAGPALRAEWAFWRRTAKLYGFGRTELLPVLSSAEAVGKYVGKYIAKHLGAREQRDVGVRLVSYVGPRVATVRFAWAGKRSTDWRQALGSLVRDLAATGRIDSASFDGMRRAFGKSWAWKWRDIVAGRAADSSRAKTECDAVHSSNVPRGTLRDNVTESVVRCNTYTQPRFSKHGIPTPRNRAPPGSSDVR